MPVKAILFDLDGTLLDTAPDFLTAINQLLSEEGRDTLGQTQIRHMVSNGSANLVSQAFGIEHNHPDFKRLRERLLHFYSLCLIEQTRPFPGVEQSLELITRAGLPWGIVTNKPLIYSQAIMTGLGLSPATLVCPDHVKAPKPDPEGILLACSQLQLDPAHCVYVGDHLRDIDAAKKAGCRTLAAAYGYLTPDEHPEQWQADAILWEPAQMPELIKEFLL